MSGYELELDQIRRAADAARSAGDQLTRLDLPASVQRVPGALPGSTSGPRIGGLSGRWQGCREFTGAGLTGHATRLRTAADEYAANDAKAEDAFRPVPTGGPRES